MKAAHEPRARRESRILVVDALSRRMQVVSQREIASLFAPGDVLVVNDAATVPASLTGRTSRGDAIEVRLAGAVGDRRWQAVLFGRGDYRTRTEDRPLPPFVEVGERFFFGRLVATVVGVDDVSRRLVEIDLGVDDESAPLAEVWSALYREGRVVQYAHVPSPLSLWDVQNVYAGRPWAVEMPSAGRVFDVASIVELHRRDVVVAAITHAAGLSSTGDDAIDARLPLPERYEVTEGTWEAIAAARRRGGRVIAVGTSVVRALEGGARNGRRSGVTDLRIHPGMRRAIVDAVLSGVHDVGTTHYELLGAFAPAEILGGALETAEREGMLGHELGDACLVWGTPRGAREVRVENGTRTGGGVVEWARARVRPELLRWSGEERRTQQRMRWLSRTDGRSQGDPNYAAKKNLKHEKNKFD